MSLPAELRLLCLQISSTPSEQLPRLTPILLRHVLRCQGALSSSGNNTSKSDGSAASILVHKLKTQLSTLLNGKSQEGRFAAIVLIKGVVEVGGWEVLRGCEPWIRGLLAILKKPDPIATKELCIITLTKIYCMTHQYQTLVRELTTPTLPTFVTECLTLLPHKASGKAVNSPQSLIDVIFRSLSTLLPRHSTIFRSFANVIRQRVKPYLAPTLSDSDFISDSVVEGARCLSVTLHQTVAKNAGGEEWARFMRAYIKSVHATADQVFRAVLEDWESSTGYNSSQVDVNKELSSANTEVDELVELPVWQGIDAGIQRLVGLLKTLEEYFRSESPSQVQIPLGSIIDLTNRMLSIVIPITSSTGSEQGGTRLHPAIDRDERDGLWSGLPQVYVAALDLVAVMATRLEFSFISLGGGCLDQISWIFTSGKNFPEFRQAVYNLISILLPLVGESLPKSSVAKLSPIIRACCKDLTPGGQTIKPEINGQKSSIMLNMNADSMLQNGLENALDMNIVEPALKEAARILLPCLLSSLPQHHLDLSLRALLDRTAILTHNKQAMLSSVVHPFIGKNGHGMPSILPHLARTFPEDDAVEALIRPRMAVIPSASSQKLLDNEPMIVEEETEEHTMQELDGVAAQQELPMVFDSHTIDATSTSAGPTKQLLKSENNFWPTGPGHNQVDDGKPTIASVQSFQVKSPSVEKELMNRAGEDVQMGEEEEDDDSDDESVHLTMQMDDMEESD